MPGKRPGIPKQQHCNGHNQLEIAKPSNYRTEERADRDAFLVLSYQNQFSFRPGNSLGISGFVTGVEVMA